MVLHVMHAPRRGPFGNDPSYYMQAAQHVARGDGLLTSVSQYFAGMNPLPQPYDDYPLWPFVLGAFGSVIGVIAAANVLPQILFVLDLLLLYFLANRFSGNATFPLTGEEVDAGHLVALVIGCNFIFFTATADPYTEGLAFALAIGSLLLLDRHPAWSGLLAGLAVLTRYQMAPVPVAVVIVLFCAGQPRAAVLHGTTAGAVVLSWFVRLRTAHVQHTPIGRWQEWVEPPTLVARAVHDLKGLVVAFNPFTDLSLWHSFGPVVLVVLALGLAFRERGAVLWASVLAGVGSLIALANFESLRRPEWVFGSRHSLAFVFLLVPALAIAITKTPPLVRVATIVFAAASVVYGGIQIYELPLPSGRGLTGADRALMQWLNANAPHATLLATRAEELSVYGTGERWHWTHCTADANATRTMLQRLPIDYVIVDDAERSCAFVRGLNDVLKTEVVFSDELRRIYLFRVIRKMTRTGAPSSVHRATG